MINLDEPVVMGILNLTPDSFFDGGKYQNMDQTKKQVEKMLNEGADIIDLGAFSSRPNAETISVETERQRLIPVLRSLVKSFSGITFSIDTFRANIAEEAISEGAAIINDISGGALDERMFDVIGGTNTPYVLMHMQGTPQTMQLNPTYKDVTQEVKQFFKSQIEKLEKKGAKIIILDPGFGFGKTVEHNYQLLNELEHFKGLGYPLLAGISRKSMINKVLGTTPAEALNGTTALNTIALMKGAKVLRVHDVKEAKECINLVKKLKG